MTSAVTDKTLICILWMPSSIVRPQAGLLSEDIHGNALDNIFSTLFHHFYFAMPSTLLPLYTGCSRPLHKERPIFKKWEYIDCGLAFSATQF